MVFVLFGTALGQTAAAGLSEGYCVAWPGIGTRFAPGYTHRGFKQVKLGMTEAQVLELLGPPLHVSFGRTAPSGWPQLQGGETIWRYSNDRSDRWGDWAWLSREVVFRNGVVTQTVKWTYRD